MTKMEKPPLLPPRDPQGRRRRSWSRSACPIGARHRAAVLAGLRAGRQAAAHARSALLLHRDQRRRHRLRLLRQDGHGPGPLRRDRPDGGGRARRAVQGRHRLHGRHRHQREPGRRLRLDRHPARRRADAHGGGRGAPRAGRDGGGRSSTAGRPAHRRRRRVQRRGQPRQESVLRRADRRALLQRPARLEQADRQQALCPRQGQAEEAEGVQDRRQADQARRRRAEGVLPGGLRHRRQGARHGAWPHDPPAGRRRVPVKIDESSIKDIPGARVVRDKNFLGVVADKEWDAIKAAQKLKVEWSNATPPFPEQAAIYDHIRKAPVRKREDVQGKRQRRRGLQDRRARGRGRIRMAVPVACLHGTGLRAWSRSRTATSPAGPARRSRTSCATASPRTLGMPMEKVRVHLGGRPRLLRPQRRRRLRHGRRRAGEGGRQAGAPAIHARAGHRLGPEGPGLDPPRPRGDRRRRQRHRLRVPQQGLLAHRRADQRQQAERHARRPVPRRSR